MKFPFDAVRRREVIVEASAFAAQFVVTGRKNGFALNELLLLARQQWHFASPTTPDKEKA